MRKGVLNLRGSLGVAAVAAWLTFTAIPSAAAPASSAGVASMAVVNGLVTAKFIDAPMPMVLEVVARETRARVHFYGRPDGYVSAELENAPLEEALRRIMQGRSAAFSYALPLGGFGDASVTELAEIHILADTGAASNPSIFEAPVRPVVARPSRVVAPLRPAGEDSLDAELLNRLAQATDVQARKVAAEELGKSWSEDAVAPLGDALAGDPSAAVRETAAKALGKTWSESAVQPLIEALSHDSDALVREQAARGLAQTAGEEAVDALVFALMRDPRWYVRDAAADALGTIGGRYAAEVLARAASNDPDEWVRETAASYAVKGGK